MGKVAELLDRVEVAVTSPDSRIHGVYRRATSNPEVHFNSGAYLTYRERELERQLSALGTRLWVAYRRGFLAAFAEATGEPATDDDASLTEDQQIFRAKSKVMISTGMSDDLNVYIETTGMSRWRVVIKDGSLDRLDESAFLAELGSATSALLEDYAANMSRLRVEHYEEGIAAGRR